MAHAGGERTHALDALRDLYAAVDRDAGRLEGLHADRLRCGRGCCACCIDDLTVFEIEAENIREAHPALLAKGVPRAPGACAFLDDAGACRIYAQRPYVCRTQGLPLRWIDESGPAGVEHRDICPLNDTGAPITALPEGDCWTIGPYEERLAALQRSFAGGAMRRVRLRDLFYEPTRELQSEDVR